MVTVTPKAAERLKKIIEANPSSTNTSGIRFAVKAGGCSGFIYIPLVYAAKPNAHDQIFESNGVKIFIDPKSLVIVDNTEIDLSDNLLEGFIFNNPRAKHACGCGVSFEIK